MKTIYITESQKNKIAEAETKVPTAQDQVHGKVNSGLMPIEMEEGAEPECNEYKLGVEEGGDISPYYHVNESEENNELQDSFKQIAEFMKENGLNVVPFPKINLDWSEQDGIFIKTGFYSPDEKAITVFCKDRHPKDILRTFAHEMIHHSQNLNGVDLNFDTTKVKDNKELEKVEAEAYLKGNIYFRKWTEYATANKSYLNESILSESHYDEYYHFTEIPNLINILNSGNFYLAGSNNNPSTSEFSALENSFRGGQNGYLSLTRMRNIEQGYQYAMSKNKDAIARITFDGNVLNNLKDVSIKPIDFVYNWNKNTPYFQDFSPVSHMAYQTSQQGRDFANGKTGRGLYNNTDYNQEMIQKFDGSQRNSERLNQEISRQFQNQAEESLVFNNNSGQIPSKSLLKAIKRIDIIIITQNENCTPEYIIKRYGLDKLSCANLINVYPFKAKGYFNLGKSSHCVNVLANSEMNDYENMSQYMAENVLNESRIIDDTNPDDVDLSSFNIKRELNPKFWKNNLLDSRIRLKLLDIADDFIEFLGVDWVKPDDIIMTGSLANFNWSKKYSDIDLHVLMDFSKVDKRTDFVKKYFDSLKNLWNEEHEGLTIFGFPVEVYVQDTNETHASSGVYSLDKNAWLTEPIRDKLAKAKVNKHLIRTKVAKYIDSIDNLIDLYKKNKKDSHKVEKISLMAKKLFDNIKNERRNELNKGHSEISNGNIVFKCLRRIGYIDKIYKLKTKAYNNLNSLP